MEGQNMHVTYHHELMKQTPPEYAATGIPFCSGDRKREDAVAGSVHKTLGLIFLYFDRWLKPFFSQADRKIPSPIQERDPYVVGLLRYLQSMRRD
jgi:hypothetical protein